MILGASYQWKRERVGGPQSRQTNSLPEATRVDGPLVASPTGVQEVGLGQLTHSCEPTQIFKFTKYNMQSRLVRVDLVLFLLNS